MFFFSNTTLINLSHTSTHGNFPYSLVILFVRNMWRSQHWKLSRPPFGPQTRRWVHCFGKITCRGYKHNAALTDGVAWQWHSALMLHNATMISRSGQAAGPIQYAAHRTPYGHSSCSAQEACLGQQRAGTESVIRILTGISNCTSSFISEWTYACNSSSTKRYGISNDME